MTNKYATFALGVILVHFALTVLHGFAHSRLAVPLNAAQTIFVAIVITGAPLIGGLLVWKGRHRTGGALLSSSMAGAFVFFGRGTIVDHRGKRALHRRPLQSNSGAWNGALLDGMTTAVTINSNGTVTGSSSGCSFTGSVTADASGKNFYDVSVTFGSSPCAFPNKTATGAGVYYLLSDGVAHQLLAGVTVGTSQGTVFFAQR